MTVSRRRLVALTLTLVSGAPFARANGRFPTAQMVQLSAGPHPARIVLRTTFGVLVGSDDGARWSWLCEATFNYGQPDVWDPPVAFGSPGADGTPLLLGIPTGLRRNFDLCSSAPVPEVGGDYTADISATEDGRTVHWVGSYLDTSTNALINRVRVSDDGGRSFRTTFDGEGAVLFLTMEAAPSNAQRVYFTAHGESPSRDLLYRSDDGGTTLRSLPLDLRGGSEGWISGIDPTNPDVLYVRSFANEPLLSREPGSTLLLRSTDGGQSFTEVTRTTGTMRGFALSDDGQTVWVGGPDDGLLRATAGGAFTRVSGVQVQCLRWHSGALYVCGNHVVDGFNLARSDDGGATMVPLVDFRTLGPPTGCAAGTPVHDVCAPTWPTVMAGFGTLPDAGARDAGAANDGGRGMDAGAASATMESSGCAGCAVGARGGRAGEAWWAVGLLAAMMGRRRRV